MKYFLFGILIIAPALASAQFGVNYHQSNLPFVGLNYEVGQRFRPELRFGVDNFIEDVDVELNLLFDILDRDEYEFYMGIGGRGDDYSGVTIPIGVNVYPLTVKNFGFHIELTPIFNEGVVLRGSWGIRYRFRKNNIP